MKIQVLKDAAALADFTAREIINLVKSKPDATLILTSGDTPIQTYKRIVELANPDDFKHIFVVGLDEWVGIPGTSEGSCRYIVEENLLKPLQISENQYTFFDSMTESLDNECKRVDELLFSRGGADLMLVGVGLNGHIGLNEPGTSFDFYCNVSNLAEMTITTGQKYFQSNTKLTQGITVGLKHLLEAKMAVLLASGNKKAEVIKQVTIQEPNVDFPATVFQLHQNGHIWLDEGAASSL